MNVNVYQHFRKDEHPFVDSIYGWIEQINRQYAPYLTDFLDPRQLFILESILRSDSELNFAFYGGYEEAERKRALIYPDYYEPSEGEFDMHLFEIEYPKKFGNLSHGKILGTLLSTGLKREFFGDIISDGESWQFFVNSEIANYVDSQISKIGNFSVRLQEKEKEDVLVPKDTWEYETTTISSLRIDSVISSVFNISRQRAKKMIESGKVKINWAETVRSDFGLELLDIVSIRGFGRLQFKEIEGKTKKDKFRVTFGVLRK